MFRRLAAAAAAAAACAAILAPAAASASTSGGWHRVRLAGTRLCLSPRHGRKSDGTAVILVPCAKAADWKMAGQVMRLRHSHEYLVGDPEAGYKASLWPDTGDIGQWTYTSSGALIRVTHPGWFALRARPARNARPRMSTAHDPSQETWAFIAP